jgi:Ecdysteroid kinase-like family
MAQVNGFHNQPEGVAYPLPTEEIGVAFPMPVEGEGRPFPMPVQGEGKKFPVDIPFAKQGEVKVTPYMTESLDKVAQAEGFKNYDVKIDHGSSIGDGFVGILFKATVREIDSDKQLTVVIKSPPENQARRQDFGAMELFKREVFMYSELLPEFVRFQEERKISSLLAFKDFPKCYFAEYNEERDDAIIIMEDLREHGCKMWNKMVPTNFEHTKLLVAALGKFHAVSFAMKEQQPEMFSKFQKLNDFMSEKFADANFSKMMAANIVKAADTLDASDTKRRNRVLRLTDDYAQQMKDLLNPELSEPFSVVTHGDCWSNNFMYQYRVGFSPHLLIRFDLTLAIFSAGNQRKSFSSTSKSLATVHR